jgi:hypothetical protein
VDRDETETETFQEGLETFYTHSSAISGFPLPVASGSSTSSSIKLAVFENWGVFVEIWFLSCIAVTYRWGLPHNPIS